MVMYIDNNNVVAYTARLEQLSRTGIPNAVRNTLNKAALDVKQVTMPDASNVFVHRKPTFFKANSKVQFSPRGTVQSMKATIGFNPKSGDKSHSVEDLEQQEGGGAIKNRSFIALKQARTGGSWGRITQSKFRLAGVRTQMLDSSSSRLNNAKNDKERFIRTVIAAGANGYVLGNKENSAGNKIVYQVNKIWRHKGKTRFKITALYALKNKRTVNPQATHFMRKSSVKTANKMDNIYIIEVQKEINRILTR